MMILDSGLLFGPPCICCRTIYPISPCTWRTSLSTGFAGKKEVYAMQLSILRSSMHTSSIDDLHMLSARGDWKRETWHRETGQRGTILQGWASRDVFQCSSRCSLQVYVWYREVLCFSSIFSVLVIPKCGRLSWPALWTTFGRTIK